jgi:hypothetical protein
MAPKKGPKLSVKRAICGLNPLSKKNFGNFGSLKRALSQKKSSEKFYVPGESLYDWTPKIN